MQQLKVILCDLDGVVFDSYGLWDQVVAMLCQRYGAEYTEVLRRELWALPMSEIDAYLADYLGVSTEVERVIEEKFEMAAALYAQVPLKEDAHCFMAWAKANAYRLIAVTSNEAALVRIGLEQAGLLDYFTAIYSSLDKGKDEKDCEYLTYVCRNESFLPQEAVLIEDHVSNLRYASHLGIQGIYMRNEWYALEATDDFVSVDHWREVAYHLLQD